MGPFDNLAAGFAIAFSVQSLSYCLLGVTLGNIVGVLPGVGILSTIAMLLPITYYLEPTHAIIMLAGIYYGAAYGGSTASILLNLPGTSSSAITCLDGYPMTKQGRAGVALLVTTIASFVGSLVGLVILALFAPPLAAIALRFSAPEYFSLMMLGLIAATMLASDVPFRGLVMVSLGLVFGLVGIDVNTGVPRFTFGTTRLLDGISLVAVALGLFGLPEILANAGSRITPKLKAKDITLRSMLPTREDWRRSWMPITRGTGVGAFFGLLPGTGGTIASFMAYALEKRVAKDPSRFGKGAIEGIASPEAANNSAIQTAFVPTLTLGIPGDAIMALMLGVMMVHNIVPGPQFIANNGAMFWAIVVSFFIGSVLLLIINIPLVTVWVRLLTIPYRYLVPAITVFICVGVYSVGYAATDLYLLLFFGVIGYAAMALGFPLAPLLLGFVLGPLLEENLRRALLMSRGNLTIFLERPISAVVIGLCVLLVIWTIVAKVRSVRAAR